MKRLGGTDAVFLSMETPSWHQHVGGLTILEPGDRPTTFERVMATIEERLVFAPKFRWKLKTVPFELDRPIWVDDKEFDIRRHIHRMAVPAPGGPKELGEAVGTLLSTQLDRRRPLWEMWYLEGIVGHKVALLLKYHHCLLDGIAGASLATALMDLEPDPAPGSMLMVPPPEEEQRAGDDPGDLALVMGAVAAGVRRPVHAARYLTSLAVKGSAMVGTMRRVESSRAILRAPKTPFNAAIGPRRELAFASVSMADVRALKNLHEVKVNDVVLAVVGGALRSYLSKLGELPDAPLVTGVPVSTRAEGDATQDNQISTMFTSLATDVADPVLRLKAVHESTKGAKEMQRAIGARQIQSIGEVATPLLLGMTLRALYRSELMSRSPLRINTLVSNVPGPPLDLYACGAKVTGIFPSSVILEGMGLNVTVMSYADRLDFGVHVDPDLVPDVWVIAGAIPGSMADLMEASGLGEPTAVADPFAVGESPAAVAAGKKKRAPAAKKSAPAGKKRSAARPAAKRPVAKRPVAKRAAGARKAVGGQG
jgi:diacylglycerol O-acyltransferase / wax synthase